MGWITEYGEHEGWAGALFADGKVSAASSADGVRVSYTAEGTFIAIADGDEWRPHDAVVGWVGMCDCPARWRSEAWTRVTDPGEADPATRRAYLQLGAMADAPPEVEDALHLQWRAHIEPDLLLSEIAELTEQQHALGERITRAVVKARYAGVSWAEIGKAAQVTRQTAHEKWRDAV